MSENNIPISAKSASLQDTEPLVNTRKYKQIREVCEVELHATGKSGEGDDDRSKNKSSSG